MQKECSLVLLYLYSFDVYVSWFSCCHFLYRDMESIWLKAMKKISTCTSPQGHRVMKDVRLTILQGVQNVCGAQMPIQMLITWVVLGKLPKWAGYEDTKEKCSEWSYLICYPLCRYWRCICFEECKNSGSHICGPQTLGNNLIFRQPKSHTIY